MWEVPPLPPTQSPRWGRARAMWRWMRMVTIIEAAKKKIPLGLVTLSHLNGLFTAGIHGFYCLIFRKKKIGSCWPLSFTWPQANTLNQELAITQLSLAILTRNLVLLDYCSWAPSCQQFLRKLFNHPQLQRNRWRTGKRKKYSAVYALVKKQT